MERPGGTFGPLGRDGWNSTIIELPIFARIGAAHVSPTHDRSPTGFSPSEHAPSPSEHAHDLARRWAASPEPVRAALGSSVALQGVVRAQGKSPAQVVQRWAWQQNIVLNPRTHNIDYMRENLNIFGADFELTAGEMKEISTGIPIPACERERALMPCPCFSVHCACPCSHSLKSSVLGGGCSDLRCMWMGGADNASERTHGCLTWDHCHGHCPTCSYGYACCHKVIGDPMIQP